MGLRVSPRPASFQTVAGVLFLEFPRGSGSSVLIASELRVAPNSRPDDHLLALPRVTPIATPSSPPPGESPGRPGPSHRLRRRSANFRVSPAVAPSDSTCRSIIRSPRISSPVLPQTRFRISPAPASTAGSMMNPAKPELCILRRGRGMNLRVQTGGHIFHRPWMPFRLHFVFSPAGRADL